MTKKRFYSEHRIQALVLSFSVSADYKITTSPDSRKVKYNKTNPSVLAGPWTICAERQGAVAHFERHPERTRSRNVRSPVRVEGAGGYPVSIGKPCLILSSVPNLTLAASDKV